MNKDFNTKEICAICGHRLGVHKADDYSCPKDIGRAGEFLETKFTRITPTTEQTELWKEAFEELGLQYFYKDDTLDRMRNIIITKYVITRRALTCALDEQQCRDSCDHKEDRSQCPFVTTKQEVPEAVECLCKNSLQAENCTRNCGHGDEPEVPEAVEFANWCADLYQWSDTEEIWVDNQGEKYSTAELFQLFKTPTNAPPKAH